MEKGKQSCKLPTLMTTLKGYSVVEGCIRNYYKYLENNMYCVVEPNHYVLRKHI